MIKFDDDDDDDDDVDMNSSCAVVSQVLLTLENDLPNSPPVPQFHANILTNYDSQSTYDGGGGRLREALNDNRFLGATSPRAVTVSQLSNTARLNDASDETQYVQRCSGAGLEEPASSAQLETSDHTYSRTENSVVLSAENSPSLLEPPTKLFRFMSPSKTTNETSSSATVMNTAAPTGTDMADVEPEAEISQLDNSPSLLRSTKLSQFLLSNKIISEQTISSTVGRNAADDTTAETHMCNFEPEVRMGQDIIGQLDNSSVEIVSVPSDCSEYSSLLASVSLLASTVEQLYGSDVEPEVQIMTQDTTGQLDNRLMLNTDMQVQSLLKPTVCSTVNDNLLASTVPLLGNVDDEQVQLLDSDVEPEVPTMTQDTTGQLDYSPSLLEPTACSTVNDNLLASTVPLLGNVDDPHVQLSCSGASKDLTVVCSATAAAAANSAGRCECVRHGASCVPVTAHAGSISSFSSTSLQVDLLSAFIHSNFAVHFGL